MEIEFNGELRGKTELASSRLHELIRNGRTPEAIYSRKCDKCSLIDDCLPKTIGRKGGVDSYLSNLISKSEETDNEAPS